MRFRITIDLEADDLEEALETMTEGMADGTYDSDLQVWDDETHSWVLSD